MMVRKISVVSACAMLVLAFTLVSLDGARAAGGDHVDIERQDWSFGGIFGQYDKAQLRRGFQVYSEVCAGCHGLRQVYFRNLMEPGGPEFSAGGVKALAKGWDNKIVAGPNEDGEVVADGELIVRDALTSDRILGPFANAKAARAANNGALPPDLSLIVKGRSVSNHQSWYLHVLTMAYDIATGYQEGGADYVYGVLTGYEDAPTGMKMSTGMNYNTVFPGHQIAMAAPLAKGAPVEYQENAGAKSSLKQNAKDVTAFLAWASDPNLNSRKTLGWQVMLYLLITTLLLYFSKKVIWERVKH